MNKIKIISEPVDPEMISITNASHRLSKLFGLPRIVWTNKAQKLSRKRPKAPHVRAPRSFHLISFNTKIGKFAYFKKHSIASKERKLGCMS